MSFQETEMLKISRLLTPEHQEALLLWVRLACFAENSVRKSFGPGISTAGSFAFKSQAYARDKNLNRSEK
jgi:hypothetical protein